MSEQEAEWRAEFGPAAGVELLTRSPNDVLQDWPVPKRVDSVRAVSEDPTLIEAPALATPAAPV